MNSGPDVALVVLSLITVLFQELLFLISSQYQQISGYAHLTVMVVAAAMYSVSFFIVVGLRLQSLLKTRPVSAEKKIEYFSFLILHFGAWIGGLCYIFGENLVDIFALRGSEFNCNENCRHAVSDVSTLLLVVASLLFSINEIHGGKISKLLKVLVRVDTAVADTDNDKRSLIQIEALAESIAFIRVFDSSFATVASLPTESGTECLPHERATVWIMFLILMGIWSLVLLLIMGPDIVGTFRRKNTWYCVLNAGVVIMLFLATGFLLIGSNSEPLGCTLNCDIFNSNFTVDCDEYKYHSTKLSLALSALVLLGPLCVGLIYRWIKLIKQN